MKEKVLRSTGRPREDGTSPALLEAARGLVLEFGYKDVSVAMIAERAGVAKQTLYRRWPSKADLVLEAFLESASRNEDYSELPFAEALEAFLNGLFANLVIDGPAIRSLIAAAQEDPEFMSKFRERFLLPRAKVVETIYMNARQRGEVGPDCDVGTAIDALHGAFWYRLLQDEPLDEAYARRLSNLLVAATGVR